MTARHLTLLGAAVGAIGAASPAMAQPEMPYEYAYPLPPGEVVYEQAPVVQPLPAPAQPSPPPAEVYHEPDYSGHPAYDEYADGYEYERSEPVYHDAPPPPAAYYPAPPAPPPHFDAESWLADCRARYRAGEGREEGGVAGGLLGAAAGGLIGNRVADGERLAGTLIGAGVGGLAGLAIGTAIGAAADRDRAEDYCEAMLERYPPGYAHAPAPAYPPPAPYGYGYPGYYGQGCACTPAVTYMPVLMAVPQRAVVREYVTEEWVEAEPRAERPASTKRRVIRTPAPAPDKRIKYTKTR